MPGLGLAEGRPLLFHLSVWRDEEPRTRLYDIFTYLQWAAAGSAGSEVARFAR